MESLPPGGSSAAGAVAVGAAVVAAAVDFAVAEPAAAEFSLLSSQATAAATSRTATNESVSAPKPDNEKTVVDVAVGSKDHSTLVKALQTADLVESLNSPGGVYTVFAPTNAAFDKLPKGTLDDLMKPEHLTDLKLILQHHAAVPILETKDIKDGQTLAMADGTKVTFHVKDGKTMVDDATIVGSVRVMNGIVHIVDTVILPPKK